LLGVADTSGVEEAIGLFRVDVLETLHQNRLFSALSHANFI
jgi:hypothetical protein